MGHTPLNILMPIWLQIAALVVVTAFWLWCHHRREQGHPHH